MKKLIDMYSTSWPELWQDQVRKLPLKERQRLLEGNYTPVAHDSLTNEELKTERDKARQFYDFDSHKELCIEITNRKRRGTCK